MRQLITPDSTFEHANQIKSNIAGILTDKKRIIAIIAPPVLMAVMYPVFQFLAGALENDRIAWYLGLATYWLIWGAVFPLLVIGFQNVKELIRPRRISRKVLLLLAVPLAGAMGAKLVPAMGAYEKESVLITILLVSSAFGNGFFEELLWRGVYTKLFPTNLFFRMIWPSVWFGLWHYIPVSISNGELTGLIGMMVGPMMMGLYFSYLTRKTNTLWWAIVAHTVGAFIMIS
jgi:membrane protease YdiL (CAAX protease family)